MEDVFGELLEAIILAPTIYDVRGAAVAALEDFRGYSECLAGCTCAPCVEFDRLAASASG